MKKGKGKFQRSLRHQGPRTDYEGTVVVQAYLRSPTGRGALKGNLTRALTVYNAKVSEVFDAIEKALFE